MDGVKGHMNLQRQINKLADYVFGLHPIPVEYYSYDNCDGTSCAGPEGYPKSISNLNVIQSELPGAPASILVNFEWTNPEIPGAPTETWCCCFKYKSASAGPPGQNNPDVVSMIAEDCESEDCGICHEIICELQCDEIPAQTPLFTTGLVGDVLFTQTDTYDDSWTGTIVDIVNTSTCEVVATLTGPISGGSPLVTTVTLDFDTEYGIYMKVLGAYPQEAQLDVSQDGVSLLTIPDLGVGGVVGDECYWLQIPEGEGEGEGEG
jgi:hypothetical protein